MTVGDWLRMAASRLRAAGVEAARLEAEVLAAHVLLVDRSWLFAHLDAEFPDLPGEALLQRREGREPLPYILGFREFYGWRFGVRPGVLVPRQETESTLELALEVGDRHDEEVSALDLGCGSGCIGLTMKLERPGWQVTLSEVSRQALAVAEENARKLEADVRLIESDLFAELTGERFDLIVSNPPYIDPCESLMPELNFEPPESLFAGEGGLDIYRRIAAEGQRFLREGGSVVIEVGHAQAQVVRELFEASGWRFMETRKDLIGHDRALAFQKK